MAKKRRRRSSPRLGTAGAPRVPAPPPLAEFEPVRHRIEADRIQSVLHEAEQLNSPHVDIGPLLGHASPLLLGVNDLHQAIAHVAFGEVELPALSLRWEQGEVTVEHIEGGALAKLTLKF